MLCSPLPPPDAENAWLTPFHGAMRFALSISERLGFLSGRDHGSKHCAISCHARHPPGETHCDLVKVMACPGGCVNGGGQPVGSVRSTVEERSGGLYQADMNYQIQRSNDNTLVTALYDGMLRGWEHTLPHRNFTQKRV